MNRSGQVLSVFVLTVALIGLGSGLVLSQTTTASLSGRIMDESQAVLPGVEITVTNLGTGAIRTTLSGDGGEYLVSDLAPGDYELEAQLPGFQTAVQSGIRLTVGRSASLNMTLTIGAVTERIVVTGDAPLVDTLTSTLRGLVDERTVRALPLNGRGFVQLAMLQAGVVAYFGGGSPTGTGNSGSGQKFTVGGARPTSNNFMMDGTNINDMNNATPGSAAGGVNLGVEAIREFEVLTSTFDATYGRNAGAVINIVTKSGTNEIHGSVFEYHRNSALDAKNFFDLADDPIPPFKRNQFGFSLGGPIVKNKIFLFGTYEGLRDREALSSVVVVPTADGRLGIGAGQGGSDILVNPGVPQYVNLYPLPNGRDFGDGTGEFLSSPGSIVDVDYYVVRYDHLLSDSDSFFVRYTIDDAIRNNPDPLELFNSFTDSRRQYVTIEHKHIFSPSTLNTVRIGYNRSRNTSDDETLSPQLELVPGTERFLLNFSTQVSGGSSSLRNVGPGGLSTLTWNSYQYADDFHYTHGRHSLRLGGSVDRILHNFTNAAFLGGRYSFNDFPSFLRGEARTFEGYIPGSNIWRGMRTTLIAFYVQEDFRWRPDLTLNLGFRFETMTTPNEVNNVQSQLTHILDPNVTVGKPYFERPGQVFHPRIGLAWDIRGDGRTSLRIGAGMFNDVLVGNFWTNAAVNSKPFNIVGTADDPDPAIFPNAFSLVQGPSSASIIRDTPDAKLPTRTQWNLTFQHELFPNSVLSFAYTGAVGRHGVRTGEANTVFPTGTVDGNPVWCLDPENRCQSGAPNNLPRRNPNFGFVLTHNTDANSSYNSFQMSFRRRFSQGLQFLNTYTWGHSIDDGSQQWGGEGRNSPQNSVDLYDHTFDRGDSQFDVRHSFSFNGIYELPFGSGRRFGTNLGSVANQILGGWEINSILILSSGNPLTIITGFNRADNQDTRNPDRPSLKSGFSGNPTDGVSAGCLNPDGSVAVAAGTPLGTADQWFDPCAFELPPLGMNGNLGRSSALSKGVIQLDLGFSKSFALTEDVAVKFRAEFFNVPNRPNLAPPRANNVFTTSGAIRGSSGRVSSTVTTSRQIQFALRIEF